ncbi:hypothetical protein CDAR_126401 [Caerostris darwini]|uniref:Uncharacterized protein n=1 Tax=Caerostris darwini TaxID=1538125 RepID=A0AAV4R3G7_9ARAC|nr:hypothetical protein CDAR_126401 [Caerostris darwini]
MLINKMKTSHNSVNNIKIVQSVNQQSKLLDATSKYYTQTNRPRNPFHYHHWTNNFRGWNSSESINTRVFMCLSKRNTLRSLRMVKQTLGTPTTGLRKIAFSLVNQSGGQTHVLVRRVNKPREIVEEAKRIE